MLHSFMATNSSYLLHSCLSPSSEPSRQSLSPSQMQIFGTQLPLSQVKRSPKQVRPSCSQYSSGSSAPSPQSSSPSQCHVPGMQRWLGHLFGKKISCLLFCCHFTQCLFTYNTVSLLCQLFMSISSFFYHEAMVIGLHFGV